MQLPGHAHGGSYTQLNNTYQGQIGDREGELEREGSCRGGGWGGEDMARQRQRIDDRQRETRGGRCMMNRDRPTEKTKKTKEQFMLCSLSVQ